MMKRVAAALLLLAVFATVKANDDLPLARNSEATSIPGRSEANSEIGSPDTTRKPGQRIKQRRFLHDTNWSLGELVEAIRNHLPGMSMNLSSNLRFDSHEESADKVPPKFSTKADEIKESATSVPSEIPSDAPTASSTPTFAPSSVSSDFPSLTPVAWTEPPAGIVAHDVPPNFPSFPSSVPSEAPSDTPSVSPSSSPSVTPSSFPSDAPSLVPSASPTASPSYGPTSIVPSLFPTASPSMFPSHEPSVAPSESPSGSPSSTPTSMPSSVPSDFPSLTPVAWTEPPAGIIADDVPSIGTDDEQCTEACNLLDSTYYMKRTFAEHCVDVCILGSMIASQKRLGWICGSCEETEFVPDDISNYPTNSPSMIPSEAPHDMPSSQLPEVPSEAPSSLPSDHLFELLQLVEVSGIPINEEKHETRSLLEIIHMDGQLSMFGAFIEISGLGDLVRESPSLTVFAPNDAAFADFDQEYLKELMLPGYELHVLQIVTFHLSVDAVTSSELGAMDEIEMLLRFGGTISVSVDEGGIELGSYANSPATIVEGDIHASNGILHEIDSILLPSFASFTPWTFLMESEANTFFRLVVVACMEDLYKGLEDVTLLVPAEGSISSQTVDFLEASENKSILKEVLSYHILADVVNYEMLRMWSATSLSAYTGESIVVTRGNDLFFNGGKVLSYSLVSRGMVYELDGLLLPPSILLSNPQILSVMPAAVSLGPPIRP